MNILTQKKDQIVEISDIKVQNTKLVGTSPMHPMGITLGKYHSADRARSILLSLAAELRACAKPIFIFEMPNE